MVTATAHCSRCQRPIPPGMDRGCPVCLLRDALELLTNSAGLTADLEGAAGAETWALHQPLPRVFGAYELLEQIGAGGMGVVFKARQIRLNRLVALKMIRADAPAAFEATERFRREALAAAALEHPHIVPIYEVGICEGRLFYTMKLVEGGNLTEHLAAYAPPPSTDPASSDRVRCRARQRAAAALVAKIARAVQFAHQHGVLHRDLKPGNIRLDAQGEPIITDFGLALAERLPSVPPLPETALGTPQFMAPEQAADWERPLTTAADIYSLGALFYTLLTGQPPFTGDTPQAILMQVAHQAPEPPSRLNPHCDPDLDVLCLRCLAKEPTARFPSAEELAEELERWLAGVPLRSQPLGLGSKCLKWARRHPAIAALSALVVLSLLLGLSGAFWGWQRAAEHARRAAAQAERAAANAAQALELAHRFQFQRAEAAFTAHRTDEGLAVLANLFQRQPDHPAAGRRLWSALVHRSWSQPLGTMPPGEARIQVAEFSPDGRRVLTATREGQVHLWNAWTGRRLGGPLPFKGRLRTAAFSPDSQLVVIGTEENGGWIWDAATGAVKTGPLAREHFIMWAGFSPDSQQVLLCARNGIARLWHAANGQPGPVQFQQNAAMVCADFSPDGRRLVTAAVDGTARLWEVVSGRSLAAMRHQERITRVQFSPDGQRLITASQDGWVRIWDGHTGDDQGTPLSHPAPVNTAQFSPDGARLVTGCGSYEGGLRWDFQTGLRQANEQHNGNRVRIWEAQTGTLLLELPPQAGALRAVEFDPNGLRVATAARDGTARLWDAISGQGLGEPLYLSGLAQQARFSLDGTRLLTALNQELAELWDARLGPPASRLQTSLATFLHAEFSPDGRTILAACRDETAMILDAHSGEQMAVLRQPAGGLRTACFSPDGALVATASTNGIIQLWHATNGAPAVAPLKHPGAITAVQFSPDGRLLVAGDWRGTAQVWETQTGNSVGRPLRHSRPVFDVGFSPDGTAVVTACRDGTARIWEARTGKLIRDGLAHTLGVYQARFSPDGQKLLTASWDRNVRIWTLPQGQLPTSPLQHPDAILSAEFSPDNWRVVTGCADGMVRLWDLRHGQLLMEPIRHGHNQVAGRFSPDAHSLVTWSGDRTARVWDATLGVPLTEPLVHAAAVTSAQFSPDSRQLVTTAGSGLHLWEAPPVKLNRQLLRELATGWSGRHLSQRGTLDAVAPGERASALQRAARLAAGNDGDPSQWFFADRGQRSLSPNGSVPVYHCVEQLVIAGTESDLIHTLSLDPTNALALAQLAVRLSSPLHPRTAWKPVLADYLSRRALRFAPDDAKILALREQVQQQLTSATTTPSAK